MAPDCKQHCRERAALVLDGHGLHGQLGDLARQRCDDQILRAGGDRNRAGRLLLKAGGRRIGILRFCFGLPFNEKGGNGRCPCIALN